MTDATTLRPLPHLRWWVVGALFLASALTYLDRQALAVLATTVQRDLGIDDQTYARIGQAFLFGYALCYLPAGWLVDRVGVRMAQSGFIAWWSLANAGTGLVSSANGLVACRGLLGIGEAGNFPAAAKAVAQWFPARERSVAVAVYTTGGTVGAAIAAPLLVAIAIPYGWRAAFIVTGIGGVVLALFWWWLYRPPSEHPRLGEKERALLMAGGVVGAAASVPLSLTALLRHPVLWMLIGCRLLTDPVWHLYLFWFAKYLQEIRGFSLADIGMTLWVVFLAADAGCLLGAFISRRLVAGGTTPVRARLLTMAGCAVVVLVGGALQPMLGHQWGWALALGSLAAAAALAWIAMAVTLLVDLVPAASVGRAQGIVGTAGALGGALSTGLVGWAVTHANYDVVFIASACLHPVVIVALFVLMPTRVPASSRAKGTP
jgi:MFS transporter, ACS family, hexuronate transporter